MNKQTQARIREATNNYFNVLAKSSIIPRPTIAPRVDGFVDGALYGVELGKSMAIDSFKDSLMILAEGGDRKVARVAQSMIQQLEADRFQSGAV